MTKRIEGAVPAIGPYSAGVAAGGFVFVSGQIPVDENGRMPSGIEAQTEQCIRNLQAVLKAGGSDLEHVVKTTVYLRSMNDFAAVNAVYAKFFCGAVLPARACVEVSALPKNAPIEIEAIAQIVSGAQP